MWWVITTEGQFLTKMYQFTYHRDVEDDPVVNAVAGGDDPAGVEQRGPARGGLTQVSTWWRHLDFCRKQTSVVRFNFFSLKPFLGSRLLESHHPGVLVDLSVLTSHHPLEGVPGAALYRGGGQASGEHLTLLLWLHCSSILPSSSVVVDLVVVVVDLVVVVVDLVVVVGLAAFSE